MLCVCVSVCVFLYEWVGVFVCVCTMYTCEKKVIVIYSVQLSDKGLIFANQLAGGLIIIALAILLCGTLFLILWFIPVKLLYYATGMYWWVSVASDSPIISN